MAYLGNFKELLGDVDDVAQWLDILDSLLDTCSVVRSRLVEQVLDLGDLAVCPLGISWTSVLEDTVEDGQKAEGDDGFFVEDVQFAADGPDRNTRAGGEDGGLAGQGVTGKSVDDRCCLLLGVF